MFGPHKDADFIRVHEPSVLEFWDGFRIKKTPLLQPYFRG